MLPLKNCEDVHLFVCLVFYIPIENFSFICRRHRYQWRASNFDLCSTLMAIEQWGFFSVPHLLWHRATVHNSHFRGPVTHLLPSDGQWSCYYLFLRLRSGRDLNTQPSKCEANALTDCATEAIMWRWPWSEIWNL